MRRAPDSRYLREDPFAVAGLWHHTPEWGPACTIVMTEACQYVAGVPGRMPVILKREDWADWLDARPIRRACCAGPIRS